MNKMLICLAGLADGTSKVAWVVECGVGKQQIEHGTGREREEDNNAGTSQAPPLLCCSMHRIINNALKSQLIPRFAVVVW